MTPLRQRMIAAMQMRGFSPRTHESYLAAVRDLAKFTRRSPDTLDHADLQRYFAHLVMERKLALVARAVGLSLRQVVALPMIVAEQLVGAIYVFRAHGSSFSSNSILIRLLLPKPCLPAKHTLTFPSL